MIAVLLIDDLAGSLDALRSTLIDSGHAVLDAWDSAEALATARLHKPQLALGALSCPGMDGLQLLREWRADPALRGLPFLVYTATPAAPGIERRALDLGARRFVTGPMAAAELVAAIGPWLAAVPGDDPEHATPPPLLAVPGAGEHPGQLLRWMEVRLAELELANRELRVSNHQMSQILKAKGAGEADLKAANAELTDARIAALNLIEDTLLAKQELERANRQLRDEMAERQLAETALRTSSQLLETAQRIARLGSWEIDVATRKMTWSAETYRIHDTTPEEFQPTLESGIGLFPPAARQVITAAVQAALESGQGYDIELEKLTTKGRLIYVRNTCVVISENGKPVKLTGVIQDITASKQAQQALRDSEEKYRAVFDHSPMSIALLTLPDGVIVEMNDACLATFDVRREEIVGKTSTELAVWARPEERVAYLQALQSQGVVHNMEVLMQRRNGQRFTALYNGNVVDIGGKAHSLNAIQDISAFKRAQAALLRSNADLEQFAYSVSHDLRQPLRMVTGHLQLLARSLKDQLDPNERDNLGFALDGARRMDQMMVSLLEYSRAGRSADGKVWMDSRAALEEALGFLAPTIAEARMQIEVGGLWPQILAQRDEMTRLFQNLISNAAKFVAPQGQACVRVDSAVDGPNWQVRIRDSGIGIAPRQLDRLFQIFSRLQPRTLYEGTGMGLALCRRIVSGHGGRIWAESAGEGQGSTFCFVLPLAGPDADSVPERPEEPAE